VHQKNQAKVDGNRGKQNKRKTHQV